MNGKCSIRVSQPRRGFVVLVVGFALAVAGEHACFAYERMSDIQPGACCQLEHGLPYYFQNMGDQPLTVTYDYASKKFKAQGKAKLLPTGQVYSNEEFTLATDEASIARAVDAAKKLEWGSLSSDQLLRADADLKFCRAVAQYEAKTQVTECETVDGEPARIMFRGDAGGSCGAYGTKLRFELIGPGRIELYQLRPSGRYRVHGTVRVQQTQQVCKDGWIDKDGNVTSTAKQEAGVVWGNTTVVSTFPENGAKDVDPKVDRLKVRFSEAVSNKSWAFVTADQGCCPQSNGQPSFVEDSTVCLLPVTLYPGIDYAVSINADDSALSPSKGTGFRSASGNQPVKPYLLKFTTAGTKPIGKSAEVTVVSTFPADSARNVDVLSPSVRIRFSGPVSSDGYSFVSTDLGKELSSSGRPMFSEGNTVCELPVSLQSGTTYSFSINSARYHGFRNAKNPDVPVTPYVVTFTTGTGEDDARLIYSGDQPGLWGAENSDLRFEYVGPGRVVMYQLPTSGRFRVFGKVKIVQTGRMCKNGWIEKDGRVLATE